MNFEPFKMSEYLSAQPQGLKFDLTGSTCEVWSTQQLLDLAGDELAPILDGNLDYAPTNGGQDLMEKVAGLYDNVTGDDILITNGGAEAIFVSLSALLGPQDHAVVHTPCFQPLISVARSTAAEVSDWTAREDDGWLPSLDTLEAMLRENTRVVLVNTPHNPSGVILDEAFLSALIKLGNERGFVLVCDEIFRWLERDEEQRPAAAVDIDAQAVSLGAMSKSFGLPGVRIGWIAVRDPALKLAMRRAKIYTTRNMNPLSLALTRTALDHQQSILGHNRKVLLDNARLLDEFAARCANKVEIVGGAATPVVFLSLRGRDADEFCNRAMDEASLALLPGSVFGDYPSHIRIGYGTSDFPRSLARLEEFLATVE